jgi:enhancing lycopene biosynthesis protein 2
MTDSKNFAIILSGCGVFDGTEIHEATLTMLAIDQAGSTYQCFAPNMLQSKVVNHFSGDVTSIDGDDNRRNVLIESGRICRGDIQELSELDLRNFDGIIFPGGFGAALNLSNVATKGPACDVHKDIIKIIEDAHRQEKIIVALCIAPTIIAKVLGKYKVELTIGDDKDIAAGIEKMGAIHTNKKSKEICVDIENRIISTPCYMLDKSIADVAISCKKAIEEALVMLDSDF